eukprot:g17256.t1
MGIQCTEYLRLSPGELERYTREASHQHRLQRLYEVRRQASLDARQQRRSSQQQRRMEEKALKTVEVRAELAAKRVQLEGLLKLKEVCDSDGNAMQTAQQRKVEDEARRCAAEALEVERQKQERWSCRPHSSGSQGSMMSIRADLNLLPSVQSVQSAHDCSCARSFYHPKEVQEFNQTWLSNISDGL